MIELESLSKLSLSLNRFDKAFQTEWMWGSFSWEPLSFAVGLGQPLSVQIPDISVPSPSEQIAFPKAS